MSSLTLTEKIIARAAGQSAVRPGDEVWTTVDRMLMNDSSGPRRIAGLIDELGGLFDPARIVLASDHFLPAASVRQADIVKLTRQWAYDRQLPHFFEYQGILHNLVLQERLVLPGMLVVGADSHTVSAGAVGAVAIAVGSTELATVLATGEVWLRVPSTIRVELEGALPAWTDMRDVTLDLLGRLKADSASHQAVEFDGSFVEGLDLEGRLVLSNQGIEMGCQNAIVVASPEFGRALVGGDADQAYSLPLPDPNANYTARHRLDTNQLEPQVAEPHFVDNVSPIRSLAPVTIDRAYIGSCVGGRYADLRAAAQVLRGRTIRVPLQIAPATQAIYRRCAADGTLHVLLEAGATVQPAGCGACAGLHSGLAADGEVLAATVTRNFKGRMGSRTASIYLASAYSVAAAAVAGRLLDPREL